MTSKVVSFIAPALKWLVFLLLGISVFPLLFTVGFLSSLSILFYRGVAIAAVDTLRSRSSTPARSWKQ